MSLTMRRGPRIALALVCHLLLLFISCPFLLQARVAASAARKASAASGRRMMSSAGTSPEEIFEHKELWLKVSVAATALVIVPYTTIVIIKEANHEHHAKENYSHMKQRHKAFPWKASDCALFDLDCKNGKSHH